MATDPWGNNLKAPKGDAATEIAEGIRTIQQNAKQLEDLSEDLGTARDTPKLRKEITQLRNETATVIQDVRAHLESISNNRVKFEKLASQFKGVLTEYQKAADLSLKKEKDIYNLLQQTMDSERDSSVKRPKRSTTYSFSLKEMGLNEVDRNIINEQNEEIKSIEKDLTQLNEIFRDMATLVDEAQPQLDDIENNVGSGLENVEVAVSDLEKAEKLACSARWKILIIALLCLIIIIIIIVIVVVLAVVLSKK
jgi:syntaxin 7